MVVLKDFFHGPNAGYLFDLYEKFLADPASVDEATRLFFEQWTPLEEDIPPVDGTAQQTAQGWGSPADLTKGVAVANLATAIRSYGYLAAQIDPLGSDPPGDPALSLEAHGLNQDELSRLPAELVGGPAAEGKSSALEAIQALRQVYSTQTGYDYAHIRVPEERRWLRDAAESGSFCPPGDPINPVHLMERLTQVEVFEHFLHRTFPGKTRFSIEGLDMLVPVLDEIVGAAAEDEICMMFLGMAHRGRLNVLAHVQEKDYAKILAEFKDPGINSTTGVELGWMGDVKYHKGALRAVESGEVITMLISMPPNPSHLEHINPVIVGMARAADSSCRQPGEAQFFDKASIPVIIHGDASFPGQGIVAETLNMSRLPGYQTGGVIHIIANNQLGFTAEPEEVRSTLSAADLAKGFKIPIIYVNADDPEACIEAARTAYAYRARFHKDFMIDLIGYRRYGHNEGDEPTYTQPQMYERIRSHPSVRRQFAEYLQERGQLEEGQADALYQKQMQHLQEIFEHLQPEDELEEPIPAPPPRGAARSVETGVDVERLTALNLALLDFPDDFNLNRKLQRAVERRRSLFEAAKSGNGKGSPDALIDWATAEELAFASLLEDGVPVRLTGEDVIRGTFSQRHAAFYDAKTGRPFIPLQAFPQARAAFEIYNSPVTENATLGFEFGYNIQAPERLVIWEAQYGDFINVGQAIIDEFIASARVKWGQTPSLVLLLPHGNEGQGPDHSSARLERFLELAASNMRVAYPTTAAQYFHLLRRQAALLKTDPLPLVVMTPKGLLRHPLTASPARAFAKDRWQPVLDDPGLSKAQARRKVRRLLLCSGRVYVDLVTANNRDESPEIAVARLEQLSPFPEEAVQKLLEGYPALEEIVWVQEEPRNMGAWDYLRPLLQKLLGGRLPLMYIGRAPSSSPAEGSTFHYAENQRRIVAAAYEAAPHEEWVDIPDLRRVD
jgi:2-oxoglutarate dehydrogenase E1 component